MPLDDPRLHEGRRYSCVLFSLPAAKSAEAILQALARRYLDVRELSTEQAANDWRLFEGTVRDSRAFYPPRLRAAGQDSDGYAYYAYLGVRRFESRTMAALALPYKSLFGRVEREIFPSESGVAPSYTCFDMEHLYRSLQVELSTGRVTRISVMVSGEPGVGMIAISGSSPLQSGIWLALEGSVEPYELCLELDRSQEGVPALRLHVDRLGNSHWHQRNSDDLSLALSGLTQLTDIGGQQTAHLPTKGQALNSSDEIGGDDVV